MPGSPTLLERTLDGPERALLRLPWPSTARIILKGSLGFLSRSSAPARWGHLAHGRRALGLLQWAEAQVIEKSA